MSEGSCGENMLQNAISNIMRHSSLQAFISPRYSFSTPANTSLSSITETDFNRAPEHTCLHEIASNPHPVVNTVTSLENSNHSTFLQPYWASHFIGPHVPFRMVAQHQHALSQNTQNTTADNAWLDSISSSRLQNGIFSDEKVEHFNINDQPKQSYEEKRAESKFYKFLHDYKTDSLSVENMVEKPTTDGVSVNDTESREYLNPLEFGIQETGYVDLAWAQELSQSFDDPYDLPIEDNQHTSEYPLSEVPYPFQENNQYLQHPNPFEEGEVLLQSGAIAQAALAFEAECQRANPHPRAWFALGTTQQENEKDVLAILALQNAVQCDEVDSSSYISLSTSQANEYLYNDAIRSLEKWCQARGLTCVSDTPSPDAKALESILQNACVTHASDVDFKVALGILCNIVHDYTQGIDIFEAALNQSPQSAQLWNKLGATLANSGNSSQALEAYRRALEFAPGSHRSRYNLAVALMNCQQNSEALHELIRILKGQEAAERDFLRDSRRKSHDVWNLIRINTELLGYPDILDIIENEDINELERVLRPL